MNEDKLAIGIKEGNGWGFIPFAGQKAHYWKEDKQPPVPMIFKGERVTFWTALCGHEAQTYKGVPLLNPGNLDQCKRCQNALKRANNQ